MSDELRRGLKLYRQIFLIEVKCPTCEKYRDEIYYSRPVEKVPHRACKKCEHLYKGDENSISMKGTSARYHKKKKAA